MYKYNFTFYLQLGNEDCQLCSGKLNLQFDYVFSIRFASVGNAIVIFEHLGNVTVEWLLLLCKV